MLFKFFSALNCSAAVDSIEKIRNERKHGVGLGLDFVLPTFFGTGGIKLKYDYNFLNKYQFHVQYSERGSDVKAIPDKFGKTSVKTSTRMGSFHLRYIPKYGFFIGGGSGIATSNLSYKTDPFLVNFYSDGGSSNISYSANHTGVFLLVEIGWQAIINRATWKWLNGVYIEFSFQPAFLVTENSDFKVKSIPDINNHRRKVDKQWRKAKTLNTVDLINIGKFF